MNSICAVQPRILVADDQPDLIDALRLLLKDPYDTAQGFRLIEAIDPYIHHRELTRMRSEPSGRRLLGERPVLLHALQRRRD